MNADAAFAVAQRLARDQDATLPVTPRILYKRLKEGGYLVSRGTETARESLSVRRTLEGMRRAVLHLRKDVFIEAVSPRIGPDQPDQLNKQASKSGNGQVMSAPW